MRLAVEPAMRKRIIWLAAPVVLAMVSQTLINQVDHVLIGRLPSADSIPGIAALEPSLILLWLVGGCLSAISVGTQALTARRFGEQDRARAGQVLTNSVAVALCTSIVASIVSWFAVPVIFPHLIRDPNVIAHGVPYLQWRMLGVVSMVTTTSYKSWFDGLGRTRVHMSAALIMNVINFFLNIALIFGKWGFPEMGMRGSGIASMVSSYLGLFFMVAWSLRGEDLKEYGAYRLKNLSRSLSWELLKLSVPSGVATIFVMGGFGMFVKIAGNLDIVSGTGQPLVTAATNNIIIILMLFFTASLAYGTATATLVSQSMGAKKKEEAEEYGWAAVRLGLIPTVILGLVIALFPDLVLHIYCKDPAVIEIARPVLRVCGCLLPVILSAMVLTQALFGAGNTKFVMFVEFGLHFFCLVPVAYICGIVLHWGMIGVWTGAFVYVLLLCAIMGWKFAEGAWKTIQI